MCEYYGAYWTRISCYLNKKNNWIVSLTQYDFLLRICKIIFEIKDNSKFETNVSVTFNYK